MRSRKYIIIITLAISFTLLGCNSKVNPPPTDPPEEGPKAVVLEGKNLQELGLDLDLNTLQPFQDEHGLMTEYYALNYRRNSARAGMTGLLMSWGDGFDLELLLFIQGYEKAKVQGAEQRIVVEDKQYSLAELVKYKLYEDDRVIILDVTDLVSGKKYLDQVQEWLDRGFPYRWMLPIWDYIRDYSHIGIVRCTILEGNNMQDLGLDLDLSKLKRFEDENGLETDYFVVNYQRDSGLAGMTGLLVGRGDGSGQELLIFMQGYKKAPNSELEPHIVVNLRKYAVAELAKYKLYEDDEVIVLDITDIFSWDKYLDRVQERIDGGSPYQWMLPIWDYIREYSDICIVKMN